jgi:hypothetical protein
MPGQMRTLCCGRRGKKAHLLKEEPSGKVHRISHFRISAGTSHRGSRFSSLKAEHCDQMNLSSVFSMTFLTLNN